MRRKSISDKTRERYKQSLNRFVSDLSKDVLVYKNPTRSACVNCGFDSLTNKSNGRCRWTAVEAQTKQSEWQAQGNNSLRYKYFVAGRCPICKGLGYLEILRKTWVRCLVNWAPSENDIANIPAGTQSSSNVLLKTDPKHLELFKNCVKIDITGVECFVASPPFLRGLGNDSVLIVIAYTPTLITPLPETEIRKNY